MKKLFFACFLLYSGIALAEGSGGTDLSANAKAGAIGIGVGGDTSITGVKPDRFIPAPAIGNVPQSGPNLFSSPEEDVIGTIGGKMIEDFYNDFCGITSGSSFTTPDGASGQTRIGFLQHPSYDRGALPEFLKNSKGATNVDSVLPKNKYWKCGGLAKVTAKENADLDLMSTSVVKSDLADHLASTIYGWPRLWALVGAVAAPSGLNAEGSGWNLSPQISGFIGSILTAGAGNYGQAKGMTFPRNKPQAIAVYLMETSPETGRQIDFEAYRLAWLKRNGYLKEQSTTPEGGDGEKAEAANVLKEGQ